MEPITKAREQWMRFAGLGMAVLVTATMCVRVFKHWSIYETFDKSFAVFVLVVLAAFPWVALWREKRRGQQIEIFEVYFLILGVSQILR